MRQPSRHPRFHVDEKAWRATGRGIAAALLSLTLCHAPPAAAAAGPEGSLRLELECRTIRSHAPIQARATLLWSGPGLLEGRLELALHSGRQNLATWRSHELALTSGEQAFDLLLPAVAAPGYAAQIEVHPRFVAKREVIDLGPRTWLVPKHNERSCVVGVSVDRHDIDERYEALRRALHIEAFQSSHERQGMPRLFTVPVRVDPRDLPVHPLAYCSFDVLLLAGKGFTLLGERQLEAIARWVRAGGSVCVVPGGGLPARHLRFLNELADADPPPFWLDQESRLHAAAPPPQGQARGFAFTFHASLGRAAIVTELPASEEDLRSPSWRRTMAFLWKVRAGRLHAAEAAGTRNDPTPPAGPDGPHSRVGPLPGDVGLAPAYDLDQITSGLMPRDVRALPFGVIVLILALFVAAIGPLDYYLLGLLRLRRLTWVLFPLTSAAFAFATVQLSDHYMGRHNHRRKVTFVDVDRKGQAVRQSRYEFVFAGREHTLRHELTNTLFYPMGQGHLGSFPGEPSYRTPPSPAYSERRAYVSAEDPEPLVYEDRFPSRFVAVQRILQWTPLLNKAFSLDAPERLVSFPWDGVRPPPPDARRVDVYYEPRAPRGTDERLVVFFLYRHGLHCMSGDPRTIGLLTRDGGRGGSSLLHRACVRPAVGLFAVVSQISPTGAPDFEDLAILDPSDPNQWLVVVVETVGDDITVTRRLYRGES